MGPAWQALARRHGRCGRVTAPTGKVPLKRQPGPQSVLTDVFRTAATHTWGLRVCQDLLQKLNSAPEPVPDSRKVAPNTEEDSSLMLGPNRPGKGQTAGLVQTAAAQAGVGREPQEKPQQEFYLKGRVCLKYSHEFCFSLKVFEFST